MKISETHFNGLLILEPRVHRDERGHFMEAFNNEVLKKAGANVNFVQDNESFSKKGALRGLHFQHAPYAQTKLVRVLDGTILDVVVDLRREEATFGQIFSLILSSENFKQLLVPKGFAHGFSVLSETAKVLYKCDEFYHPEAEGGILYNDPSLQIDWGLPEASLILSEKDKQNPTLDQVNFKF